MDLVEGGGPVCCSSVPETEEAMVTEQRWAEIRRLQERERLSVSEIARQLELDRKTVRKYRRMDAWVPYQRAPGRNHAAHHARRLAARASARGGRLRPSALPGAADSGLSGQLHHRQALRGPAP